MANSIKSWMMVSAMAVGIALLAADLVSQAMDNQIAQFNETLRDGGVSLTSPDYLK